MDSGRWTPATKFHPLLTMCKYASLQRHKLTGVLKHQPINNLCHNCHVSAPSFQMKYHHKVSFWFILPHFTF